MNQEDPNASARPLIVPLGDSALLVRFSDTLEDAANRQALAFSRTLANDPISGVFEVVPSLVSVLVRYDAMRVDPARLSGEIALRIAWAGSEAAPNVHRMAVAFGGTDGPDLETVAAQLGLEVPDFIAAHNANPLRVLATGFAPGFLYCGFHPGQLNVPRRSVVRPLVSAGSVLFAAGQTAIAATEVPTGWNVIGRTSYRNFDPSRVPPTLIAAGDFVTFEISA
jgi:inhibitor of KinA